MSSKINFQANLNKFSKKIFHLSLKNFKSSKALVTRVLSVAEKFKLCWKTLKNWTFQWEKQIFQLSLFTSLGKCWSVATITDTTKHPGFPLPQQKLINWLQFLLDFELRWSGKANISSNKSCHFWDALFVCLWPHLD